VVEGELQRRLGANLAAVRKGLGLSQEAFADVLGIHRTYVGGLERGERNVTLRTVERLAGSLGVPVDHLLAAPPATARPRRRSRRTAVGR
jgi:transcriptional regulator with XRE-family HTH domain